MTGLWFENEAMVRVTTVCTDSRNNKRYSAQTDLILGHTQGNYGVSLLRYNLLNNILSLASVTIPLIDNFFVIWIMVINTSI